MTKEEGLQVGTTTVEAPISDGSFTEVQAGIKSSIELNGHVNFAKEMYEDMKRVDPNAVCPSCGGKPVGKRVCEVCGAGKSIDKIDYFRLENDGILERLNIPVDFTRETYNKSVLMKDKEHLRDNKNFTDYVDKLERLMLSIGRGEKLKSSLFISAPSGFGKEHFVYTLMCIAIEKGMTVFPYIDLTQAERLIESYDKTGFTEIDKINESRKKDDKEDFIQELIGFTDIELYESDLCILKVPHVNNGQSFKVALSIIDRRARRGKSTIIMSRYHIRYFAMLDSFKEIAGITDPNSTRPKNLKVIEFTK